MYSIHSIKPKRSENIAPQENYRQYRNQLAADFNQCCGYCDDSDVLADKSCFHIDHFAPKNKFPKLETSYTNLVYACRFCNVHKSSHWIGDDANTPNNGNEGFLDPCDQNYDVHLTRLDNGEILGLTPLGCYIAKKLHLHLLRHRYLWQSCRLRALRSEVRELVKALRASKNTASPNYVRLLEAFEELTVRIEKYEYRAAN